MPKSGSSSKGDVRYSVPVGESRVVFESPANGRPCEVAVTAIGLNGLDFEIDPAFEIEPGTVISNATVEIGGSTLEGDIRVGRGGDGAGGLFRPASHDIREELEAIVGRLEQVPLEPAHGASAPRYDRGFQNAVEAGFLTPGQALARGKRHIWAENLVAKHKLPMEAALAVTDGRKTLAVAMRLLTARPAISIQHASRPADGSKSFVLSLIAVVALAAVAVWAFALQPDLEAPSVSAGGVEVTSNATGELVRLEGPDPDSVLATYCDVTALGRELEPVKLTNHGDPRSGVKLGVLRDRASPDALYAIYISLDPTTQRWIAGNGRDPLTAFQAPPTSASN